MKNLWKGIKNILNINNKKDFHISELLHKAKHINKKKDMANSFNKFFTEVGPNLNKQIPKSKYTQETKCQSSTKNSPFFVVIPHHTKGNW